MHTQTATTLAGSPGILSRAHGGQLCAVSASCLSICSPQPRDACRSLRASARKEPQSHRKIDERMARWKPACGNKRVPWGEDRGKGSECRQWKPRRRWPRSTRAARARCRGGDGREPPERLWRVARCDGSACVPELAHAAGHSGRGSVSRRRRENLSPASRIRKVGWSVGITM